MSVGEGLVRVFARCIALASIESGEEFVPVVRDLSCNSLFTISGIGVFARAPTCGNSADERPMPYSYSRPINRTALPLCRHGRGFARVLHVSAVKALPEGLGLTV
jgi:hypothetical protein